MVFTGLVLTECRVAAVWLGTFLLGCGNSEERKWECYMLLSYNNSQSVTGKTPVDFDLLTAVF